MLALVLPLASATRSHGTEPSSDAAILIEARHLVSLGRFYETSLGLQVLSRDAATGRVVFDAGGTRLVIVPRRPLDEPQNVTTRVLLHDAALDSARARLQALRIPFREMIAPDGSMWALFFQDPEGNPLGYARPVVAPEAWPTALRSAGGVEERGRSGVVELMVYGGLYGAWLSVAIPIAADVQDPEDVGAVVLLASPVAVLAAHQYGKRTRITPGQARTITVAGNLATWQGIGWALLEDADDEDTALAGALAGTGAIVASALLVRGREISTGQATVLHSATYWGGWYGVVGAGMADAREEAFVSTVLATSAAGFVGGALWGTRHDIGASRARLISLGGLLGTLVGWGIVLVEQPDSEAVVWGIPGATGLAGLGFTWWKTREQNDAPELRSGLRLDGPGAAMPRAGERLRFRLLSARF